MRGTVWTLFQGLKTNDVHRFHPVVELLPTANGANTYPAAGNASNGLSTRDSLEGAVRR